MVFQVTILLIYQLIGELTVHLLGLPVPGPVVGMALLFLALVVRKGVSEEMDRTATGLLSHLSLLFVPAGAGVMIHLGLIRQEWLAISTALVASTVITIAVTALVMRWLVPPPDPDADSDADADAGEARKTGVGA